jgi:hypothetical protein
VAIQIKGAYNVAMPSNYRNYREYYKEYSRRPEVIKRRQEKARARAATPEGRQLQKQNSAKYYAKHGARLLAQQRERVRTDREFAARKSQYVKDYLKRLKEQLFTALGNKCACCGEANPQFLTIDHIHGGGTRHRRSLGSGRSMYLEIIREGIPRDKYRILCMNCNFSFGHWGFCPHDLHKK